LPAWELLPVLLLCAVFFDDQRDDVTRQPGAYRIKQPLDIYEHSSSGAEQR